MSTFIGERRLHLFTFVESLVRCKNYELYECLKEVVQVIFTRTNKNAKVAHMSLQKTMNFTAGHQ